MAIASRRTIAILDDEIDRIDAMTRLLSERFSSARVVTFDNAPAMVDWLAGDLSSCALICLDHDLGPNRRIDGEAFDPGIGRDVVDWLANQSPTCPVLIHTTNTIAAPGMMAALEDAGWQCARVSPYGDLLWIREMWITEVAVMLDDRRTEE
jgi:hypothetical protein